MTPTSRRPSSSSLRRLWLPMNDGRSVADDGADVQAQAGQRPRVDAVESLVDLADDTDLDAGLAPLGERAQHHAVGDLDVVDEQLLAAPRR